MSRFTGEVPGPGRRGTGLDPPVGEDLEVGEERAAIRGWAVSAEGKLRPERTVACQALPAGQSLVQEVEGPRWTDSSDLMLGLGSCSCSGPVAWSRQVAWSRLLPHLLPPPWGPRFRVEADVLAEQPLGPAHQGNYCCPLGPAAAPPWARAERRRGCGNTSGRPNSAGSARGLLSRSQHGGPSLHLGSKLEPAREPPPLRGRYTAEGIGCLDQRGASGL